METHSRTPLRSAANGDKSSSANRQRARFVRPISPTTLERIYAENRPRRPAVSRLERATVWGSLILSSWCIFYFGAQLVRGWLS